MVNGGALRIAFFGTPEFAVPALDALLRSHHTVVAVVTQPDRPRGRGHHTSDAPVKARATAAGLLVLQPERLKDQGLVDAFRGLDLDLGVVAAYGKILPEVVLVLPRLGMINIHASILPRYRGAAPVHRAIMGGERETGVTIMRVVQALDAGPMLAVARWPIAPDASSEEVERELAVLGAELLVPAIDELSAGRAREIPQDNAAATYAHRLTKDEGLVDWRWPAERIHDLIRGLQPWPLAYTFLNSRRFILHRSTPSTDAAGVAPGTIVEAAGDCLRVAAGAGSVLVREIQAEGKRIMPVREFLAGHRLAAGEQFRPDR